MISRIRFQCFSESFFIRPLHQDKERIEIPSAEAGNIAWHFINAETGSHDSINRVAIAATTEDILNIVRYTFGITYRKDTIAWSRYLTHVQLFTERLVTGTLLPEEPDHMLYEQLQQTCRKEFMCVDRIRVYVEEKFRQKLSSQEQMYLAIHLHRILSDVIASGEDNQG
ncbi:MAG: PRD domain-containing protein [Stecheria intestinalis]|nr:PRD domain-containing protein [Stecheria intestinalis]MDY4681297.1 PRD domain-containing protein [Lachnospiraceae bacterium]